MFGINLDPLREYLWAAACVAILLGGIYIVHHLKEVGRQQQLDDDAKLTAANIIHVAEVEARAEVLVSQRDSTLRTALAAPLALPAIPVRVCIARNPSAPALAVSSDAPGIIRSDSGPVTLPSPMENWIPSFGNSVDVGPTIEKLLADADAEIAYWRGYYADCVKQGICKAPTD